MNNKPSYFINLSSSQQAIAEMPAESHLLVLAGPGTGKTHTLLRRLIYLIDHEGLEPSSEILVLSFSRAAVAEIRTRLSVLVKDGANTEIRFLNVRTFDSMATRLMVAADEETDLTGLDYDARIKLAVRRLAESDSEAASILTEVRHVVIDEIQDLVGPRARLVKSILQTIDGGFTLLGDPAQGIFNYLVDNPMAGPTSDEFLDWVRSNWSDKLTELNLDTNFRVKSASANIATTIRSTVLHPRTRNQAFVALRQTISDLPSAGHAKKPDMQVIAPSLMPTALLCRTNAEAMYIAQQLNKSGVSSLVPPKIEEKGIPAWVGRMFMAWKDRFINRDNFKSRWGVLIGSNYTVSADVAWELLKTLEGRGGHDLDVEKLRDSLRHGRDWTFDSEAFQDKRKVLVTTIHQAKGREFDRVIILPSDTGRVHPDSQEGFDEARIMYVAATRARRDIYKLNRVGLPIMYEAPCASRRMRFIGQEPNGSRLFEAGVEGDILETSYVGVNLFPTTALADAAQNLIWTRLSPGEQLMIIPKQQRSNIIFYLAWKNPVSNKPIPLAIMDPLFKVDLEQYVRTFSPRNEIIYRPMDGLRVYERRTIILPPFPENIHEPYATSGFCLGIGIKGILEVSPASL